MPFLKLLDCQRVKYKNNTFIVRLFCVDRHRESFLELIDKYIDVVFCNESEILSLFKENDLQSCKESISSICELVIITLGSKGSLVINKEGV